MELWCTEVVVHEDVQRLFSLETSLEMLEKVGHRGNSYKTDMKSKVEVKQYVSHTFSNTVQTYV